MNRWSALPRGAFLALLCLLPACTQVSARKIVALDSFQRVFVETRRNENHHLDEFFVTELKHLGKDASSGPLTMMPENADVVLTYDSRWEWDFKTYLIELTLELHTARSHKKLADARYYQPSIRTKEPSEIIRQLLADLWSKPPGK